MLLNSFGIGGYLGTTFENHLCYADGLCLISLSSNRMQQLLHICNNYSVDHRYNGSETFSFFFQEKQSKKYFTIFFPWSNKNPKVKQCRYLGTTISNKNSDRKVTNDK